MKGKRRFEELTSLHYSSASTEQYAINLIDKLSLLMLDVYKADPSWQSCASFISLHMGFV